MMASDENVGALLRGFVVLTVLGCGPSCNQTPQDQQSNPPKVKVAKNEAPKSPPKALARRETTREELVRDLRARHPSLFEDTSQEEKAREPFTDFQISERASSIFEREASLARKQMALKDYESALQHFNKALSTGKADAQALSERGYAKWLLQKVPEATEDFWSAAGENAGSEIRAQIWYNLALVFERTGDQEMSRAAFAVSLALAPSAQTRAKLGERSTCRSSIKFGPEIAEVPQAGTARGWLGVHRRLGLDGEPATETDARDLVCHAVSAGRGGPPEGGEGVCTGNPPFALSCCSGMGGFMAREMDVVPLDNNQFFTLDHGMVGGWPRGCQGVARPELSVEGRFALVRSDASEVFPNGDFDPETVPRAEEEDFSGDPPCRMSPRENKVTVYRLSDAKRLLEVRSFSPQVPEVVIRENEKRIEVKGEGCDTVVPLE